MFDRHAYARSIPIEALPEVVGATIEEATAILAPHGITGVRAKIIDGRAQAVTMDISANRINVSVRNDEIIAVLGFG